MFGSPALGSILVMLDLLRAGRAPIVITRQHRKLVRAALRGGARTDRDDHAEARRLRFDMCRGPQHGPMGTNIRMAFLLSREFFENRIDSAFVNHSPARVPLYGRM